MPLECHERQATVAYFRDTVRGLMFQSMLQHSVQSEIQVLRVPRYNNFLRTWPRNKFSNFLEMAKGIKGSYQPATVAQQVAHPLVVRKVIGSNLGPTPRHN